MAGDWIKMQTNLDTNPKVFVIAEELDLPDLHVVGLLWKVWSWADQHSQDGNAVSVTVSRLDRIVGVTGFADALRKVDWLVGRDSSLTFPRFAEHNGKTAKSRAQTNDRVKRKRNGSSVTEALPEKRREEKSNTHTHSPKNTKLKNQISKPHELWADGWQIWLDTWEGRMGKPLDPIQAEFQLVDLHSRPPEKAKADLHFSQQKSAKSILDSDNDFSAKRNSTRPSTNSAGKNLI